MDLDKEMKDIQENYKKEDSILVWLSIIVLVVLGAFLINYIISKINLWTMPHYKIMATGEVFQQGDGKKCLAGVTYLFNENNRSGVNYQIMMDINGKPLACNFVKIN